jgi:hypothetical protein
MTVYVESNYVLEIALGQRESATAERILESASQGNFPLMIPSFALFEPITTVMRRSEKRRKLMNQMHEEMSDLRRSRPHEEDVLGLEYVPDLFAAIEQRENQRLISTVQRMYAVSGVIEINGEVYGEAIGIASRYGFKKMQDAIICAAILMHLQATQTPGPHIFATRDASDFADPDIVAQFERFDCVIVRTFAECAQRLRLDR